MTFRIYHYTLGYKVFWKIFHFLADHKLLKHWYMVPMADNSDIVTLGKRAVKNIYIKKGYKNYKCPCCDKKRG